MQKFILTENYLIEFSNSLKIIKFKNIIWIFTSNINYDYKNLQRHIKIMDRNRILYNIVYKYSSKNANLFKETLNKIIQKFPNALVGYTSDNIKATSKNNFKSILNEFALKNSLM